MPINERGEFVRERAAPEQAYGDAENIYNRCAALKQKKDALPEFIENPEGFYYWNEGRLDWVENEIDTIEELATKGGIVDLADPYNQDSDGKMNIPDFIEKMRKSVIFSRRVEQEVRDRSTSQNKIEDDRA